MTAGRVTLLGLGAAFVIACFMLVRSAYVKHYAIVDTTPPWIYFRYVDDDSPPLEEAYVFRDGSWLLLAVCYDSNGDWIPDPFSPLNNARFATSQYQTAVEVTHSMSQSVRRLR